jgi:hypothetical protein
MTSKVVQLRLITWEELSLMKSDIGWVYITLSKVFIPSSHFYCHHFEYITKKTILILAYQLSTTIISHLFSTSYRYMFTLYCLLQSSIFHCFHTVISYPYDFYIAYHLRYLTYPFRMFKYFYCSSVLLLYNNLYRYYRWMLRW